MVEGEKSAPKVAPAKPSTAPKAVSSQKILTSKVRAPTRLYAKAVFTGYKRGLRNQHESQTILKIEGCRRKEDGRFYIGKRCVYVFKAKNRRCVPQHPKQKTRLRAVWGKVIRLHGNNGCVRAKFRKNLPGHAMGHRVRIMMYPSTI